MSSKKSSKTILIYILFNSLNSPLQVRNETVTKNSIDKGRIDKNSLVLLVPDESGDLPKGKQKNKKSVSAKQFQKPSVEEIAAYCMERGNSIDAQQFYDFYESKGWLVGKSKMKDWKSSIRTWERNNAACAATGNKPVSSEYTREPTADEMAF
ncbi:MAG: hypothetical protein K6G00_11185 [Treponema sp.]|nr:hypothetical protein [Treponema sp.]